MRRLLTPYKPCRIKVKIANKYIVTMKIVIFNNFLTVKNFALSLNGHELNERLLYAHSMHTKKPLLNGFDT